MGPARVTPRRAAPRRAAQRFNVQLQDGQVHVEVVLVLVKLQVHGPKEAERAVSRETMSTGWGTGARMRSHPFAA